MLIDSPGFIATEIAVRSLTAKSVLTQRTCLVEIGIIL
jgi:hypothetical protein